MPVLGCCWLVQASALWVVGGLQGGRGPEGRGGRDGCMVRQGVASWPGMARGGASGSERPKVKTKAWKGSQCIHTFLYSKKSIDVGKAQSCMYLLAI